MATALKARTFVWGAATSPLPGESECGDQYVVEAFDHGAMVAMIDALGHGPDAARAASIAAQTLSRHARLAPPALIQLCHAQLRGTRGAAVSIAAFDATRRTLTWIGIGNVTGTLVSADAMARPRERHLLTYGGVVGDRLPEFNASVLTVAAGDTLILTTDGVVPYTQLVLPATIDPQWLAERILGRFAKRTDDAAVLVMCLNGEG